MSSRRDRSRAYPGSAARPSDRPLMGNSRHMPGDSATGESSSCRDGAHRPPSDTCSCQRTRQGYQRGGGASRRAAVRGGRPRRSWCGPRGRAIDEQAVALLREAERALPGSRLPAAGEGARPARGRAVSRGQARATRRAQPGGHRRRPPSRRPATLADALSAHLYALWGAHEPDTALAAARRSSRWPRRRATRNASLKAGHGG
jgi:hypothetical protein